VFWNPIRKVRFTGEPQFNRHTPANATTTTAPAPMVR
jgi:hypothetical protein